MIPILHIAGVLDFWLGEPNLSDYERLLDDYDVSAVEEIHMQCALTYGWEIKKMKTKPLDL